LLYAGNSSKDLSTPLKKIRLVKMINTGRQSAGNQTKLFGSRILRDYTQPPSTKNDFGPTLNINKEN
jgi:hypothetical protein